MDRKLSLAAVASACGVSAATVSNWESGRRFPSGRHLDDLVRVTRLPASCLFARDGVAAGAPSSGPVARVLGRNLRAWRRRQQLPLKHLAADCGVALSIVSDWETGKRFPSERRLNRLAHLTALSVADLFA